MAGKQRNGNWSELMPKLAANGFEVTQSTSATDAVLVAKGGVAAVLVPAPSGGAAYAVHPGAVVKGQIARLMDRGYQKFLKTSDFEIPATAAQLHAIHNFGEELTLLTSGTSFYNEGLGTTSDLYHYDRLNGREAEETRGARPWERAGGH